jgi:hypothetical protein
MVFRKLLLKDEDFNHFMDLVSAQEPKLKDLYFQREGSLKQSMERANEIQQEVALIRSSCGNALYALQLWEQTLMLERNLVIAQYQLPLADAGHPESRITYAQPSGWWA